MIVQLRWLRARVLFVHFQGVWEAKTVRLFTVLLFYGFTRLRAAPDSKVSSGTRRFERDGPSLVVGSEVLLAPVPKCSIKRET